jgi:hypothetical protein
MTGSPQGIASFPGLEQLIDASISLSHGISPSVATLTIVPQIGLVTEIGTLTLAFGDTVLEFPDCRVEHSSFERTAAGGVWRLSLVDRRWRWRFGQISGTYNVRRDNSTLQQGENDTIDTQRTPQQLATLCLEAMEETDFDVSDLPTEPRPSVEWDYDVPAVALAALCDQLGCRVVLGLDNRVAIRRVGVGASLDALQAIEAGMIVNPPPRPDAIAVVCGANRYQVDFPLEAVALAEATSQSSDSILPLEQLSYAPNGGWSKSDVPFFLQVASEFRALAQKSVFKYYRIKLPVAIPGYDASGGQATRLEQILPIENAQVEVAEQDGQLVSQPAAVFGVWYRENEDIVNTAASLRPLISTSAGAAPDESRYQRPFSIDAARGLVIFSEPVYANKHASATGGSGHEVVVGPADLVLRASCQLRDPQTSSLERHVRTRTLESSSGTTTRYLRHDEIVLTHVPNYSSDYHLSGLTTNAADVNAQADEFLDAAEREYADSMPQTVRYGGLVPIELDGAIEQISFHVGSAGTTTHVARHTELPRAALTYQHRRRIERQRAAEDTPASISPRGLGRVLNSLANPQSRFQS